MHARKPACGELKATSVAMSDGRRGWDGLGTRNGVGTGPDPGPLARTRALVELSVLRDRRSTLASQGEGVVAGEALLQSQVGGAAFSQRWHGRVAHCIGTNAQGGVCRFRGRRSTFTRPGTDFVAGTIFSQGHVQISPQSPHFRKVDGKKHTKKRKKERKKERDR